MKEGFKKITLVLSPLDVAKLKALVDQTGFGQGVVVRMSIQDKYTKMFPPYAAGSGPITTTPTSTMSNAEYCERVMNGKVITTEGIARCEYKTGYGFTITPLDIIKERKPTAPAA